MTPSEKIALGRALEELKRPEAKAAQGTRTDLGRQLSVPPNQKSEPHQVRPVVAQAVGLSEASYTRAKELVTAAESGDEIAAEKVAEMDATGKISKPHRDWKATGSARAQPPMTCQVCKIAHLSQRPPSPLSRRESQ